MNTVSLQHAQIHLAELVEQAAHGQPFLIQHLQERAQRGSKERFHAALATVPKGETRADDQYL